MAFCSILVVIYFYLGLIILCECEGGRYNHHHHPHPPHHHNHHNHKKHNKHPPPPPGSQISLPPSPPPESYYPPSPSAPPPDDGNYEETTFDVRAFGAIGDGVSDDTEAFKSAWDAACQQNDVDFAILVVPFGYCFMVQSTIFTGPCESDIVFQVDGVVMPPDGPENWPRNLSRRQWLVFYRADNMLMQGGGLIDGKGEEWWNLPCKPHKGANGMIMQGPCDSPVAIRFFMSSNVTVQGVRIRNSPKVHFRFDNCSNVYVDSIRINSPALSPNTDGIHIENTDNAQIYNSVISTGDDCVSIGSGCYGVDIRNLTCGPGHGISIGSLGNRKTRACVSNVRVRDSVIKDSDNGVRIKTWQGGSGWVTGVTFSNLHMDNVRNPIIIDQFYCITSTSSTTSQMIGKESLPCSNQTSGVFVSDIQYESIKGTYDIRSPPMHFACSDSVPCTNITLSDIELLPAQGDIVLDPYCWNAYGGLETLTIPPVYCLLDGLPGSILENQVGYC